MLGDFFVLCIHKDALRVVVGQQVPGRGICFGKGVIAAGQTISVCPLDCERSIRASRLAVNLLAIAEDIESCSCQRFAISRNLADDDLVFHIVLKDQRSAVGCDLGFSTRIKLHIQDQILSPVRLFIARRRCRLSYGIVAGLNVVFLIRLSPLQFQITALITVKVG